MEGYNVKSNPFSPILLYAQNVQKRGHIQKKNCTNSLRCGRCGGNHLKKTCIIGIQNAQERKCPNCNQQHNAGYGGCQYVKVEKQVLQQHIITKTPRFSLRQQIWSEVRTGNENKNGNNRTNPNTQAGQNNTHTRARAQQPLNQIRHQNTANPNGETRNNQQRNQTNPPHPRNQNAWGRRPSNQQNQLNQYPSLQTTPQANPNQTNQLRTQTQWNPIAGPSTPWNPIAGPSTPRAKRRRGPDSGTSGQQDTTSSDTPTQQPQMTNQTHSGPPATHTQPPTNNTQTPTANTQTPIAIPQTPTATLQTLPTITQTLPAIPQTPQTTAQLHQTTAQTTSNPQNTSNTPPPNPVANHITDQTTIILAAINQIKTEMEENNKRIFHFLTLMINGTIQEGTTKDTLLLEVQFLNNPGQNPPPNMTQEHIPTLEELTAPEIMEAIPSQNSTTFTTANAGTGFSPAASSSTGRQNPPAL
ncbi:unnamed protein product [Meganyctiphanes norvegica]|uniref:Uncharacterized protein n=1 Tax=Meganyctiphanes norvegica TaxID=48144 RepID=A0AAV2SMS9_MEGNR